MHSIIPFETIDSTNSYLKENFRSLSEGDVCFSLHQTGGRGRLGRVWQDEGKDLLFSVLFKENLSERFLKVLPLIAGVAMVKTLEKLGIESSVKWPNDILLHDKKCCGILVEGVSGETVDSLVLGVGLNLNEESFSGELESKATSLYLETKKTYQQEEVLSIYLEELDSLLEDYASSGSLYLEILQEHFYLKGKNVSLNYHGEGLEGVALGVDGEGELILLVGKEIKHIHSGEVTLQNSYQK